MSLIESKSPLIEDIMSTEDDTLGSSISLCISENSIQIKEKLKPKMIKEVDAASTERNLEEKWWLKKPEVSLAVSTGKLAETVKHLTAPSPDVSSSMKEFLEKENLCKHNKSEGEIKDKDDTLCDVLASAAFDKFPSDFENATDEDIGSIFEEMNKIAGALSSNSAYDQIKSADSSKHPMEEEKSVEELLEEAERLVKKNCNSLSKSGSKSDTLAADDNQQYSGSIDRAKQLEADIFQLIENEVHKETEKIRRSPRNEKRRDSSPNVEIVFENINSGLMPPKSLKLQRKKFEDQKVEISSSSDLDDPIEKHSKSEDLKTSNKSDSDKESIQKEIIDVDKDFFENLLKNSKEKAECGMSGSSSFDQEDFSHFLKLLQGQSDKKEYESKESNSVMDFLLKPIESTVEKMLNEGKTPEFPEKEISEILSRELETSKTPKHEHKLANTDSNKSNDDSKKVEGFAESSHKMPGKDASKKSDRNNSGSSRSGTNFNVTRVNSKIELYTVDLTPRLELFADEIPKLLAEKSIENSEKNTNALEGISNLSQMTSDNKKLAKTKNIDKKCADPRKTRTITPKVQRLDMIDKKAKLKDIQIGKSKSSDQICKAPASLKNSLESIKSARSAEIPKRLPKVPPKPKVQSKLFNKYAPKTKIPLKPQGDTRKTGSTSSLPLTCNGVHAKSPDNITRNIMASGDSKYSMTKINWEILCQEERHRNSLLKQQLESEVKIYKSQIENMRVSFEEELFALKKQNIILKAKMDEISLNDKRIELEPRKNDTKIILLEKELEKQESMISAYKTENIKLMQETKRMQEDIKNMQSKHRSVISNTDENQRWTERIKDLEEENLKLNLEISKLKQKNTDYTLKNDDLSQQNDLLADELAIFKDQLITKNNFITERLQAMTTTEMELKKQIEELTVKLSSKTEQLRITKLELEKIQQTNLPLEKELLESRVKESNLQEKLQLAKSHVEREKQLSQKLKDQVIVDNKRIMDLNRQVREMERILKRKNPDSVSALILTANSEQERVGVEKVKLLEERIVYLENEIKSNEEIAQQKLLDFQNKFSEVKEKYTDQIADLESKLLLTSKKERKVCNNVFTQTALGRFESKSVQTNKIEEKPMEYKDERKDQKKAFKQSIKEDAHLIATIRGLKLELANKEKTILKVSKEFQDLQKTTKKLQKEREKFLNEKKMYKNGDLERTKSLTNSETRLLGSKGTEGNDPNSNVYQNGHMSDPTIHKLSNSNHKIYDPLQYTDDRDSTLNKRLTEENGILKEELNKMNKDFMALKNKRLHDLNLLQEEHEREMANLVKEYSINYGDSKTVKLQGQLNTQVAIISHLKQQIENLRDYKEKAVVFKAERDHLENKVKALNEKVKYLSAPGSEQLQLLQDKITILQQRHESREMTLQNLVRDLLRSRTQCKDCKGEKRQLCYFRQELDHILQMLQEFANIH
ncbi:centrosomal protein of 162 kDa [Prorops nasuta]|uniref:centrosomal protein of 162 kDa n=1 Tax=Prorops nasuta TaxID=863751 RepID=UPI0034CFB5A8